MLEHLPPGLHLVLASRADPPLPLARLRAGGQLAELRTADLRFSEQEAAALLRESAGADLPAAVVAALAARTEGWVAGLRLAALSLAGQADPAGFVAAFSGSHRYVLDYLTEEVLDRQDEEVRTFLLETSLLERLSGGLCDAVTGRADSRAMLERVERAGLFLVPLDEVRGWWRYHHLFAGLLRARLQQQRPGRVVSLHRAAAAWCEEHGLADDAVRHALAAGDPAWAARLVERHADAFLRPQRGRDPAPLAFGAAGRSSVRDASAPAAWPRRSWLRHGLPGGSGRGRARCRRPRAWQAQRGDEPLRRPPAGRRATGQCPRGDRAPARPARALRGDAALAIRLQPAGPCPTGRGRLADAHLVRWYQAAADWLRGQPGRAERGLTEVLAELRAAGQLFAAFSPCASATTWARCSAPRATWMRRWRPTGKRSRRPASGQPDSLPGLAHVGLAQVPYQRNELTAALRHATRGIDACRQLTFTQPLATGLAIAGLDPARAG